MMNIIKSIGLVSFGDSFTYGQGATANNGYAQQLAAYIAGTYNNYAVRGQGSTVATKKAYEVLPEGYRRQVVTWMAGLNDLRATGAASLPKLEHNLRSFLASCFLRDCLPASLLRRTGAWNNLNSIYGGKSFASGGVGLFQSGNLSASLEYEFYGDNLVIGAYPTDGVEAGVYQNLLISIDGGAPVTFQLTGITNETASYSVKIFRGLGLGGHMVKIMPSTLSLYTVVDYVGTLVDGGTQSPVLIAEIPYLPTLTPAQISLWNTANTMINDVVAEFCGLDIEVVKTNDFYSMATGVSSDAIHPNDVGHTQILNAFKDKITLVTP